MGNPENQDFRPGDVASALNLLGIEWRTRESFERLHALAKQSHFVLAHCTVLYSLVDIQNIYQSVPAATPRPPHFSEETQNLYETMLLQNAVEAVLFPERLRDQDVNWDGLARRWDNYVASRQNEILSGASLFTAESGWTRSRAITDAWCREIARTPAIVRIGTVTGDSAHKALIGAALSLWMERKQFVDEATDWPDQRRRLWDDFTGRWCTTGLADQLQLANAMLSTERARVLESLNPADAQAASASTKNGGDGIIYDPIDVAVMTINRNPGLSDRAVAKRAGISPSTLTRSAIYQRVKKILASPPPPRGTKDGTTGHIEAATDPDE